MQIYISYVWSVDIPLFKMQVDLPGSVLCFNRMALDLPYLLLLHSRIVYSVAGSRSLTFILVCV